MATKITKNALIQDIKQSLGWPAVDVELEESHYEWAIDRAIQKYQRHAYGEALTQDWYVISATCGTSAYTTPANITSVLQWQLGTDYLAGNTAELFTFENLMWNIGALNVWNWGNFGLVSYHLALSNLDLIRQMIPSQYNVRYNRAENKLYLNPAPSADTTLWIKTYTTVAPSALYDSDWVYEWARAEAMEALGLIRGKYSSLPGPGGQINLDGASLLSKAEREKQRLEEELVKGRSEPLGFKIG